MSLFVYLDGTDYAGSIRARAGGDQGLAGLTSAADGTASYGGVIVDDPSGAVTSTGWKAVRVEENACSQPRLFTGYVIDRTISRGPHFRTAAGRIFDTNLIDQNAVLHMRLITDSDGQRPAETDIERIDWLLGSAYLSGLIADYGDVDRSSPKNFQEADYRGQYADDVLNDIAGPIGRQAYARWDASHSAVGLVYGLPTAYWGTSTLRISNVLSDVDDTTTFEPYIDAQLLRDPTEVYSTVRYAYANGVVIRKNATTASTFIERGLNVDNSRVGAEATATGMADSLLSRDSTENDTITVTVRLPAAKVGLIEAGQRISVKFSHLPGYDSFTYARVTRRVTVQVEGVSDQYEVTLTLNDKGNGNGGGAGAPPTNQLPAPTTGPTGTCAGGYDYTPAGTYPPNNSLTTPANAIAYYLDAGIIQPFVPTPGAVGDWHFNVLGAGGTPDFAGVLTGSFARLIFVGPGIAQVRTANYDGADNLGWTLNHDPGTGIVTDATGTFACGTTAAISIPDDGQCIHWIDVSDSAVITGTKWGYAGVVWTPKASVPPQPSQPVNQETVGTGDGATTTFTTGFPFADGSLKVFVDLLDQTAAVTSQDGATGSFTLGFAPKPGEQVTVTYQGR